MIQASERVPAQRATWPRFFAPSVLVWAVTLLGGVIRFAGFDTLGLWIDEGYTVMFTRMSWTQVLGLEGAYDSHPPLYFATAKLFGLVFPELIAGRLVCVVAGTLTLPVLYLLARRVTNEWLALSATLILALSPLHMWYSREARMYVPSMLFVALAYWALLEFYTKPGRRWAILYGVSVLLAMYYSYSSFYALVPQVVLIAMVLVKYKRSGIQIVWALGGAVVLYLPWMPQWLAAVRDADPFRGTYLGVWPEKLATHLVGITGVAERQFFLGPEALPWETRPLLYWVFVALVLPGIVVGGVKLARTSRPGLITTLALLATILVTVLTSIVSPGLADRTIICALLGWAILIGAALSRKALPVWANALGIMGYATVLLFSVVSIYAIFTQADKQRWQDMAADVAAAAPAGDPVLLPRPVNFAILDAYQPGALDGVVITSTVGLTADAVWFAYHETPRFAEFHQRLQDLGYQRVMHKYYFNPLFLDLYAKPSANVTALEQMVRLDGSR